ncbi:MAG TPA: hypothetical protein DCE17_05905 [Lactobacillus sp.]|nr:hypothetical protein [Lactobacillus sp.]HAP23653.1 hypothetical protein [Lactobacillus sp.]
MMKKFLSVRIAILTRNMRLRALFIHLQQKFMDKQLERLVRASGKLDRLVEKYGREVKKPQ